MPTMCETKEGIQFDCWMRQVEALLEKCGVDNSDMDRGPWRVYFDDRYSPEDAVREQGRCLL